MRAETGLVSWMGPRRRESEADVDVSVDDFPGVCFGDSYAVHGSSCVGHGGWWVRASDCAEDWKGNVRWRWEAMSIYQSSRVIVKRG